MRYVIWIVITQLCMLIEKIVCSKNSVLFRQDLGLRFKSEPKIGNFDVFYQNMYFWLFFVNERLSFWFSCFLCMNRKHEKTSNYSTYTVYIVNFGCQFSWVSVPVPVSAQVCFRFRLKYRFRSITTINT